MPIYFSKFLASLILVPIIFIITTVEAQAYFDPGTGSQLLQLLLASLFGALFTIKTYWLKIKSFIKNPLNKNRKENDD
jgi:hypothetical protein